MVFLEISQNSQESTCARVSFLIKLQSSCNFIKKEALAQVFSCEFCEISENTFFTGHVWWLLLGVSWMLLWTVDICLLLVLNFVFHSLHLISASYSSFIIQTSSESASFSSFKYRFLSSVEAATRGVLWKKLFLKNSRNCLFFNKVVGLRQGHLS